ncbi:MAG: hypothetical protein HN353_02515 [Bdellovibrionales bacterium]|jgi:hypothetical protein|nr:hypothetical protein [Bdellovibrionales bacterium]MBT3525559.1 hypothetical protein [Bdellovibrionales bacterium]MBT7668082.1 hypothetical protein [Bdellovibrionales bacterium]MBT7767338.1 hypothetical protein [Bdellovibrionales bacterium]
MMELRQIGSHIGMVVRLLCIGVLALTISKATLATTYIYLPLEKQLKESDGVIHGRFIGKDYKRNSRGEVITTAKFELIDFAGIDRTRAMNPNSFAVNYPGGRWQGVTYQVHGTPRFESGEEVVLLVREMSDGFMLTNLGMAKYQLRSQDYRIYLKSALFPNHPKLSKIWFDRFKQMVIDRFGEPMSPPNLDKVVDQIDRSNGGGGMTLANHGGRKPASTPAESLGGQARGQSINVLWLILILAVLGGGATILVNRK